MFPTRLYKETASSPCNAAESKHWLSFHESPSYHQYPVIHQYPFIHHHHHHRTHLYCPTKTSIHQSFKQASISLPPNMKLKQKALFTAPNKWRLGCVLPCSVMALDATFSWTGPLWSCCFISGVNGTLLDQKYLEADGENLPKNIVLGFGSWSTQIMVTAPQHRYTGYTYVYYSGSVATFGKASTSSASDEVPRPMIVPLVHLGICPSFFHVGNPTASLPKGQVFPTQSNRSKVKKEPKFCNHFYQNSPYLAKFIIWRFLKPFLGPKRLPSPYHNHPSRLAHRSFHHQWTHPRVPRGVPPRRRRCLSPPNHFATDRPPAPCWSFGSARGQWPWKAIFEYFSGHHLGDWMFNVLFVVNLFADQHLLDWSMLTNLVV